MADELWEIYRLNQDYNFSLLVEFKLEDLNHKFTVLNTRLLLSSAAPLMNGLTAHADDGTLTYSGRIYWPRSLKVNAILKAL